MTPNGRCRVLNGDELPPDPDPALRTAIAAASDVALAAYPRPVTEVERRSAALLPSQSVGSVAPR